MKTRAHFLLGFQNIAVDFVKFSNAGEAFFITFFTVTDISHSTEYFLVISAKPELKLGQHLVDGRIVSVLKYGGAIPVSAAFVSTRDSGCLAHDSYFLSLQSMIYDMILESYA